MKVKVAAKLNLSLNVFPLQNGMHPLDSVAVSVNLFDTVNVISNNTSNTINIYGTSHIEMQQNTAYKAAKEFNKVFGGGGCDITIQKGIPVGAGLGGSSADAAAVVYCLARLHNINNINKLSQVCAAVGSDVNFMMQGGLGRMTGRGEKTQFFSFDETLNFAVTFFDEQISTAQVFSTFDKMPCNMSLSDNDKLLHALLRNDIVTAGSQCRNFLQPCTQSISDYAKAYLSFCTKNDLHTFLTGSGSAYAILCNSADSAKSISSLLCQQGFDSRAVCSVSKSIWEI